MKEIPAELIDFITRGNKFIIAGHLEPDGDCVGSQLALASALKRLGKKAIPCSAGPFKRTEVKPYEKFFTPSPSEADLKDARVIIADCGALERTGKLAPLLESLPLAIIDHHAGGQYAEGGQSAGPVFIDGNAPSATLLVLHLIEALGLSLAPEEAELLLFGLCTDTGFFRHVDEKGAESFEAAAAMIRAGASPKKAFQDIHGGKSLDSRILMGHILSRAESHFNGRLILSTEEYEETQRFGLEGRDSDAVYQMLQSIGGMEAIVIIRQEKPDNCTVGFRSRDKVDVAAVAKSFGGGGHKNAAGLSIAGTIDELKPRILAAFQNIL
ncbi:DHH family phosphoesterase [Leadbettera azotonutricia]|uniref:DHH superfamily protein, subfamily 1 n=1 Tax=Leadbettera azotonutricia (strain ATCC BAA-888 / DSM 13862 / ZAS-9) TaxID=545695 RepID=F5YAD6_LEAAZ|nr:bifunctional oligoribonuclease/PAP phosphatase NrnA [Leadbettera azotonutricia]AEF82151.1 DHH superfamily protein, subfamily 1 [Leadbettera azotonutricia ZAS-9]